jgi:hypothetical protein
VTNRFFDSSQAWRLTSICQDGHEVENNNEIYRCRKEWVT